MIRSENLTRKYGTFTAVNRINLNIPAGQIYGFLGPNGSGKTTTILMLLGIVRPTSGEIHLFGERATPERLDLRKRIGVVPEKHPHGVWKWMTAHDYLSMFADLFAVRDAGARIRHLLESSGLYGVRAERVSTFSRGMLQKLSIVRALLHDPDILLLDEPISGLDPNGIKQVRDLILGENREGRTIFISSHMLSEMEKICHRIAIIYRGELMAEDDMSSLLARLARDRRIEVELEQVPQDLAARLRQLPFVVDCETNGNCVTVSVSKEGDHRKSLSSYLIGEQLLPLRLEEKGLSLEDAFITITEDKMQLLTAAESAL